MNKGGHKPSFQVEQKKSEMRFSCTCGRRYFSKPAVYTHIKNKHNNDKVNFRIIDSAKGEVQNSRAFRLDYIKYPEKEARLMTLADTTFVTISSALKENDLKLSKFILDDDKLSDSEEEDQRQAYIQQKIHHFMSNHKLDDLLRIVKERFQLELETFKIKKYQLNIRKQIAKFFNQCFMWRVQTQILLYFIKKIANNQQIQACQKDLWKESQKQLEEILQNYCNQWLLIRN